MGRWYSTGKNLPLPFGRAGEDKKDKADLAVSFPPVEGTIRLKADNFTFERFNLSPLRLTAYSSPPGIRAEIEQAVACGINATGRIDIAGEEIGLDVVLAATEAELERTTVCLLDEHHDVKGTYSLKGRITGRGKREQLKSSVKGNFEFSARDGEFVGAVKTTGIYCKPSCPARHPKQEHVEFFTTPAEAREVGAPEDQQVRCSCV